MRADKFLFNYRQLGRRSARALIESGGLEVNGERLTDVAFNIGRFDRVSIGAEVIQSLKPVYLMVNKPKGYVCATEDKENLTVMEFVKEIEQKLHIVGRLDKFTTGLVLLTNDSHWSRSISEPRSKKAKVYIVEAEEPLSERMLVAFKTGVFFEKEEVWTQPAEVEPLSPMSLRLTIFEGMHHQIKRMFLKFDNRVVNLHREAVASIRLDIPEGSCRQIVLNQAEQSARVDSSSKRLSKFINF